MMSLLSILTLESAIDNFPVIDIKCSRLPFLALNSTLVRFLFYQFSQNHFVDLDKSIIVL